MTSTTTLPLSMRAARLMGVACLCASALGAHAQSDFSIAGNVGATTDYRFRGISQSSFNPALQAGVDLSHKSGAYVGLWASSIRWISDYVGASGATEVDVYAGYKMELAKDVVLDLGAISYQYPGNTASNVTVNANTNELYGAISFAMVTLKYSQSTGNFVANNNSSGSAYVDLSANFDMGNGFTLTPHIGSQTIPNQANNAGNYSDYSLTLTKDFGGGVTAAAALVGTDAKDAFYKVGTFDNLGKNGIVVSVKYTF